MISKKLPILIEYILVLFFKNKATYLLHTYFR
jgi:hypothetical protein